MNNKYWKKLPLLSVAITLTAGLLYQQINKLPAQNLADKSQPAEVRPLCYEIAMPVKTPEADLRNLQNDLKTLKHLYKSGKINKNTYMTNKK